MIQANSNNIEMKRYRNWDPLDDLESPSARIKKTRYNRPAENQKIEEISRQYGLSPLSKRGAHGRHLMSNDDGYMRNEDQSLPEPDIGDRYYNPRDWDPSDDLESPSARNEETRYNRPSEKRKIGEISGYYRLNPSVKRVAHGRHGLSNDDYYVRNEDQSSPEPIRDRDYFAGAEACTISGIDNDEDNMLDYDCPPRTDHCITSEMDMEEEILYYHGYRARVRNYRMFESSANEENLWDCIAQAFEESDSATFAEIIHDCPQDLRLLTLMKMDPKSRSNVLDQISQIEIEKQKNDPKSIFPTVMTDILAGTHFNNPICIICDKGFCNANENNRVPIENVVKKECGTHIMHWACFRQNVIDGKMPLHGPCACFPSR